MKIHWKWSEFAGWCSLAAVFAAGAVYLASLLPLGDASMRLYRTADTLVLIGWTGCLVLGSAHSYVNRGD